MELCSLKGTESRDVLYYLNAKAVIIPALFCTLVVFGPLLKGGSEVEEAGCLVHQTQPLDSVSF